MTAYIFIEIISNISRCSWEKGQLKIVAFSFGIFTKGVVVLAMETRSLIVTDLRDMVISEIPI